MCKPYTGVWLLIGLLVPIIQGCSLFGVGESEYACPEPGKGVCKSARQIYKDTDSTPTENLFPTPPKLHTEPDLRLVTPEAVPNRTPAQILRIWIAPWVDRQGNWHSDSVVMTDIAPRDWQSAIPVYSPADD
ncbi:TraV family lipoprotein [Endozoicomonas arenosclerae]|uniref:TraV family lipoprotein n=1 Tax=Endozoicomonas arenosclerae TaxID=1633495 RepID=UPI00078293CC|nr:TraV family lipoprotein [Endozoicomonas arenosclerae]